MKKLVIFGIFGFIAAWALLWPQLARRREEARRSSMSSSLKVRAVDFSPNYDSPTWKRNAKLFERNKASAAALFAGATKVESFRLFPVERKELKRPFIPDFPSYGRPTTQNHDFAQRLGKIVLDPKSYVFPGRSIKSCYFEPGVAFRVWKNKEFSDTIICFGCNQLAVLENSTKVPISSIGGRLKGRFFVAGDFDVVRVQLLELAKEALPEMTRGNG
jgi:hypothetical protein